MTTDRREKTISREGEGIMEPTHIPTAATVDAAPQHSPLPWRADAMAQYVWAKDRNGSFPVLQIRGWGHLTGGGGLRLSDVAAYAVQQANAEFIVRACNSHDDLLAALKWAMRHLRGHVSFGSNGDAFNRVTGDELAGFVPKWDKAEAAIAKAEGRLS